MISTLWIGDVKNCHFHHSLSFWDFEFAKVDLTQNLSGSRKIFTFLYCAYEKLFTHFDFFLFVASSTESSAGESGSGGAAKEASTKPTSITDGEIEVTSNNHNSATNSNQPNVKKSTLMSNTGAIPKSISFDKGKKYFRTLEIVNF